MFTTSVYFFRKELLFMNAKRIAALVAVVLIGLLYLSTLILAFMGNPHTSGLLMASLFCTIVVPVVIYAWQLVIRLMAGKKEDPPNE